MQLPALFAASPIFDIATQKVEHNSCHFASIAERLGVRQSPGAFPSLFGESVGDWRSPEPLLWRSVEITNLAETPVSAPLRRVQAGFGHRFRLTPPCRQIRPSHSTSRT